MNIELLADGSKLLKIPPMQGMPFFSDWLRVLLVRGLAREITRRNEQDESGRPKVDIVPYEEQPAILDDAGQVGIICVGCGRPIWGEVHSGFIGGRKMSVGKGHATHSVRASRMVRMDKIRIGGFIQMSFTEPYGQHDQIRKWRVQPVFKMGLGCASCKSKYEDVKQDTASQNEFRALYANFLLTAADKENKSRAEVDAPKIIQAMQVRCLHGFSEVFCAVCRRNKGIKGGFESGKVQVKAPQELTPFLDVFSKDALDGGVELVERT